MENGFQIFDIVLFAVVAGALLLRLRSVLGRRTGNERQRADPLIAPKPLPVPANQVVADERHPDEARPALAAGLTGIAALKAADPTFEEQSFLNGARGAFEIIVRAFAAGDATALEPLLNKDVYGAFVEAIRARQAAKETLQTTLVAIKSASIVEGAVEGAAGLVTVKIVSDQINVTRAADGRVVEGDAEKVVEKTDFWTFSRSLRARDPNWTLVATHSP
jgi:predicted lipid-binding transport protein (Tim44 family)